MACGMEIEMTDSTQPEALRLAELFTADEWPGHMTLVSYARECVAELRRQHTRIAELEAQLEAIGAGGVSGPLMGRGSIAASAGSEPVAHLWQHSETGRTRIVMPDMIVDADASWQVVGPLYLGAAPPTAQAEGWRPIETAPKDSGYLLLRGGREQDIASGYWLQSAYAGNGAWIWPFVHMTPRFWAPLPPTTSAGSGKGE